MFNLSKGSLKQLIEHKTVFGSNSSIRPLKKPLLKVINITSLFNSQAEFEQDEIETRNRTYLDLENVQFGIELFDGINKIKTLLDTKLNHMVLPYYNYPDLVLESYRRERDYKDANTEKLEQLLEEEQTKLQIGTYLQLHQYSIVSDPSKIVKDDVNNGVSVSVDDIIADIENDLDGKARPVPVC